MTVRKQVFARRARVRRARVPRDDPAGTVRPGILAPTPFYEEPARPRRGRGDGCRNQGGEPGRLERDVALG